jgi:hypothetical protein
LAAILGVEGESITFLAMASHFVLDEKSDKKLQLKSSIEVRLLDSLLDYSTMAPKRRLY